MYGPGQYVEPFGLATLSLLIVTFCFGFFMKKNPKVLAQMAQTAGLRHDHRGFLSCHPRDARPQPVTPVKRGTLNMADNQASPFACPSPGLRIKQGGPPLRRPEPEEVAAFPERARSLLEGTAKSQAACLERGAYSLEWVEGRHFLLVGGTGSGVGGALAAAVLNLLGASGSLTIVARDLKRSLGYQSALLLKEKADQAGLGERFQWLNTGAALEGERFAQIVQAVKEAGADRVVYVNTVAAAMSGLLPGYPPVFVRDVDEEGLFEWELSPLDERSIEATKFTMGTMAVELPDALEKAGVAVEAAAFRRLARERRPEQPGPRFARIRSSGRLFNQPVSAQGDHPGRNLFRLPCGKADHRLLPARDEDPGPEHGARGDGHGLPVRNPDGKGRHSMHRPAGACPGHAGPNRQGRSGESDNPFPRLDLHEASLDLWFLEVLTRLNEDENSDFYFKRWIRP